MGAACETTVAGTLNYQINEVMKHGTINPWRFCPVQPACVVVVDADAAAAAAAACSDSFVASRNHSERNGRLDYELVRSLHSSKTASLSRAAI